MSSQERNTDRGHKRRSKAACKACRQSKVKCGMEQPPCNRCQRMGYPCERDASFKRIRNQDRFRQLEARIQDLQQVVPVQQYPTNTPATQPSIPSQGDACNAETTMPPAARADIDVDAGSAPAACDGACFTIKGLELSSDEAADLFAKFAKYHVYVPFLDPAMSSEECHRDSEFLFWAIISVAVREQQPHSEFLSRLSPYFEESLGKIVLGGTSPLKEVQALILLVLWPPFNARFWRDRSLNLMSIAVSTGLYLGLHIPFHEQEYTNVRCDLSDADRAERLRTWLACLSVAHSAALECGLPLHLPFASTNFAEPGSITAALDVPLDLQHYFIIQQHSYNIFVNIPQRVNSSTYHEKLKDHLEKADAELELYISADIGSMSLMNRIRYATVQLYLRVMYLNVDPSLLYQKQGVLKAYDTATSLIDTFISEDGARDLLLYSPRTTFRTLLLACCVIFKVVFSSYGSHIDYDLGKRLYFAAQLCMIPQAVQYTELRDMPLRCTNLLKKLWQLGEMNSSMRSLPPQLVVQTRFGASILFHCLAVYHDRLALFHRQVDKAVPASDDAVEDFQALNLPELDLNGVFNDYTTGSDWDPILGLPDLQCYI